MPSTSPAPTPQCRKCREPLPQRGDGRGRPAAYCSPACRQAAYRERRQAATTAQPTANPRPHAGNGTTLSPEQQQVLELALEAQEELRHLVRMLAPGTPGEDHASLDAVARADRLKHHVAAVAAGTVLLARHRNSPWSRIARVLHISTETARRTYHHSNITRQLERLGPRTTPRIVSEAPPRPNRREAPSPPHDPAQRHTTPPTAALPPVSPRAASQLAPVLSRLQHAAGLSLRQLGLQVRVSASYLSRVFVGERFPSWDLTERLARALGADLAPLRTIWEDEQRQLAAPAPPLCACHTGPTDSRACLHSALRALHQRAGFPSAQAIATVAGHNLTPRDTEDVLNGTRTLSWETTMRLIHVLDGEPAFFHPLWEAAHPTAEPAASTATTGDSATSRVSNLLMAFGETLRTPAPALSR